MTKATTKILYTVLSTVFLCTSVFAADRPIDQTGAPKPSVASIGADVADLSRALGLSQYFPDVYCPSVVSALKSAADVGHRCMVTFVGVKLLGAKDYTQLSDLNTDILAPLNLLTLTSADQQTIQGIWGVYTRANRMQHWYGGLLVKELTDVNTFVQGIDVIDVKVKQEMNHAVDILSRLYTVGNDLAILAQMTGLTTQGKENTKCCIVM